MLESSQLLKTLLISSFDGVFIYDTKLIIADYNSVIKDWFASSADDLKGSNLLVSFPFLAEVAPQLQDALSGKTIAIKNKSYRSSHSPVKVYWEANFSPLWDEQKNIIGGMGIVHKTSAKAIDNDSITNKRLKDALKAYTFANSRLHCIVNSTQDHIAAIDANFRFILFNERFKRSFESFSGKKVNLGVNLLDCLNHLPEEQNKERQNWTRVLRGDEFQLIEKRISNNGEVFYVEIAYNLVKDPEGNIIGASHIIRDITERMRNEELRVASEKRFSKVFQEAQVGFVLIDLKTGNFSQANSAFYQLLAYNSEELKKLETKDITHPDDFLQEEQLMQKLLKGETLSYNLEKRMFSKQGTEIWVSVSATLLHDAYNKPEFALEILEDITERKLAQEKLQETLKALEERNHELDQFVYKTSHDLRSPLSSILGMVNLMKIETDNEMYPEYIDRIEGRINRLDNFINSMLSYSRNSRAEIACERIDYEQIVEHCLEDLKYYKGFDRVSINFKIEGKENEFYSDLLRVKIVCNNLISNAIKYQDFNKNNSKLDILIQIKPDKTILNFQDNGIGIKKEYLKNIANMFFRATEEAEGSGLGMYIVRQTIDKLGGNIHIDSEGHLQGVNITVELPNQNMLIFRTGQAAEVQKLA